MPEKRQTPVDHVAGLPLPIYPFNDTNSPGMNWHHHFHSEEECFTNKTGGLFIHHSRVQRVPTKLHDEYHAIYAGPEISDNVNQRFLLGVFAVAGYMPRYAIDVTRSRDEDKIVKLKYREYKEMIKPDMLKGEYVRGGANLRRASKFMMSVILKQDIKTIDDSILEEFLVSPDKSRRITLATYIIDQLVDQSTDSIKDKYHQIYHRHLIFNRQLGDPSQAVLRVTNPFIPENIDKLHYKVLKSISEVS